MTEHQDEGSLGSLVPRRRLLTETQLLEMRREREERGLVTYREPPPPVVFDASVVERDIAKLEAMVAGVSRLAPMLSAMRERAAVHDATPARLPREYEDAIAREILDADFEEVAQNDVALDVVPSDPVPATSEPTSETPALLQEPLEPVDERVTGDAPTPEPDAPSEEASGVDVGLPSGATVRLTPETLSRMMHPTLFGDRPEDQPEEPGAAEAREESIGRSRQMIAMLEAASGGKPDLQGLRRHEVLLVDAAAVEATHPDVAERLRNLSPFLERLLFRLDEALRKVTIAEAASVRIVPDPEERMTPGRAAGEGIGRRLIRGLSGG